MAPWSQPWWKQSRWAWDAPASPQRGQGRGAARQQKELMRSLAIQQAKASIVAGGSAGYTCSPGAPHSLPTSQPDAQPAAPPPPGWAHGQHAWDRTQQQKDLALKIRHIGAVLAESADPQERAVLSASLKRLRAQAA
eukprot:89943-Lingulodinium_polyedra.AAC.1